MLNRTLLSMLLAIVSATAPAQVQDDPTRPAQTSAPVAAAAQQRASFSLQLQAVMQLGASRTAVINGKTVRQGQYIQGALVQEIHPHSAVIAYDENGEWKSMTLWVSQRESVKTNAAENY